MKKKSRVIADMWFELNKVDRLGQYEKTQIRFKSSGNKRIFVRVIVNIGEVENSLVVLDDSEKYRSISQWVS